MFIKALKAKIHRATVTAAKVDYPGSVAIDADLLSAAGISPYEAVLMANITNGARAETYIVPAPAGSGEVSVLGAAARLFNPKDTIIIINFAYYTPDEVKKLKPKIVICGEHNKIKEIH